MLLVVRIVTVAAVKINEDGLLWWLGCRGEQALSYKRHALGITAYR